MKKRIDSHPEPLGNIGLVGVDDALLAQIKACLTPKYALIVPAVSEGLFEHMEEGGVILDAVVVGLEADDAVRLAQRIHTYDNLVPILILSISSSVPSLKRTLMFSPFLGNEVGVWDSGDIDILPDALKEAVTRRQQRLQHHNMLSTAHIRLEKLPLQHPDPTHYLDRLLDYAPVGVITVDLSGTITTLNRQAQNILATKGHRLLGRPLTRFFPEQERARIVALQAVDRVEDAGHFCAVFKLDTKTGQRQYVEVTSAPLAYRTGQRGYMLILQDVTSRVEAESERRRAEEELRLHAEVLRKFHQITSSEDLELDNKIDQVLSLGCKQFGLPTGILTRIENNTLVVIRSIGQNGKYQADSQHNVESAFCGIAVESAEPLAISDISQDRFASHPAHIHLGQKAYIGTSVQVDEEVQGTLCFFGPYPRKYPFNSADTELIKLMSRWISSETQRECSAALMRKLSGALERTADAILITDQNRYIEYVNPAFESLTGYKKDEVIGKKTYFLRSGLHDAKFYEDLLNIIREGKAFRGILVNRKKDGSLYYEQKTISPLCDKAGNITHFISTGHDITDLIEAEEQNRAHQVELAHVARLSTLGEMTSGLAHELNQPLCAITTYAQTCLHILQGEDCSPERVRYGVDQIVKQAELASEIFRRLRDFARKGEIRREPVSMQRLVSEVVEFVTAEARQKRVRLERNVSENLMPVAVDAIQIEQVLINLVRNAMDALKDMPESRRVINLSVGEGEEGWITVEIKDMGPGCSLDMIDRLFEPFVTSKREGLGIGLSISQGIVEAHGGVLWLAENSEEGATFRFTLPTVQEINEENSKRLLHRSRSG
jgi:PAS domain S-box-containing protein